MLVVQKYGGTSVGSVERIKGVAKRVAATRAAGHQVAVVVSAMSGETNRLLALAKEVTTQPDERESDVLVSTGEQVTVALLAMALKDMGYPAFSLLGHQVHIETDSAYGRARIKTIKTDRLLSGLQQGQIVVIAGFQGVDEKDNITTLGRGGSDTTAVAIAAALKADVCEIYTDVDGVYSADPRICPQRANSSASRMMRCWNWPASVQKCYRFVQWSLPSVIRCRCMCGRVSHLTKAPGWSKRSRTWKR